MTITFALGVAILFGAGAYLLLKRDLIRIVGGIILISNAVTLFILVVGLTRGAAPIYPLPTDRPISDPLVQSMALTAIVITFGVTALLLSLVYRVSTANEPVNEPVNGEDRAADERSGAGEGGE
jgi:multicomponent Na+:H+ antiporter subunit C